MRGTGAKAFWGFLLAMILAIGAAVSILPGCSDDNAPVITDSDTGAAAD
jgi:hypothetical protein